MRDRGRAADEVDELAAHEWTQGGVNEVGARARDRGREAAPEAAPAPGGFVAEAAAGIALAFTPQRLSEPRQGTETGVMHAVAVVPA